MFHYQFNIAQDGKHLFRTDWIDDEKLVEQVENELVERFPRDHGFSILKTRRNATMWQVEIGV